MDERLRPFAAALASIVARRLAERVWKQSQEFGGEQCREDQSRHCGGYVSTTLEGAETHEDHSAEH